MTCCTTGACKHAYRIGSLLVLSLLTVGSAGAADNLTYPPVNGYAVSRAVNYDDLDLGSHKDVRKLYRRLESTVRTVCDARRAYSQQYIKAVIRPCVITAMANAVTDIDAPLLTAYYREQVGVEDEVKVAAER